MNRSTNLIVAAVVLICLFSTSVLAQGMSHTRKGSELVKNGVENSVRLAREAELYDWLSSEKPQSVSEINASLSAQEKKQLRTPEDRRSGKAPLRIGLVKSITPAADASSGFRRGQLFKNASRGTLVSTDDGGFLWTTVIKSEGARSLRLHFQNFSIPDSAELYVYNESGAVRGPYTGQGTDGSGELWTNSIFGDTAIVALRFFGASTDDDLRNTRFVLTGVGHVGNDKPEADEQSWSSDQCGNNASCMVDASCGNLGPATDAANAVAKMEWIRGPYIYTCTGGLIADTDASTERWLFLTANHCLNKSSNNLETFFNFTTSSCNGSCPVNPAPNTTGATKLASGGSGDYTLFELRSGSLPSSAVFLGWNNSPIAQSNGADLYRVSNPNFGPQVYSHHRVDTGAVTCTGWPRGERIYSNDISGATDGGSSGSPVVNSAGEIVGQLSGCCGYNCSDVCDSGSNSTVDGALADYWNNVAQYLDPDSGGPGGCSSDAECDDGQFCNGAEVCNAGVCESGSDPCPGQGCDEAADQCQECTLLPAGASCTADAECCSNKCKGPRGRQTCR